MGVWELLDVVVSAVLRTALDCYERNLEPARSERSLHSIFRLTAFVPRST